MQLNQKQEAFIQINKNMLEQLIDLELEDLKLAAVNLPTQEEREEARLVYKRIEYYKGFLKEINKPKKNKKKTDKEFTGI